MFLIAVAKSDSEKSAGTYGKQTLIRLPTAGFEIKLRMKPCVDTLFHVICKEHYAERTRAEHAAEGCENLPVCARHENHRGADEKEDYRSRHVMFEQGRDAHNARNYSRNENSVFELLYFRIEK